ncbi:MAG: hypothetical protein WD749_07710 [Phycisphaerales bacterium]
MDRARATLAWLDPAQLGLVRAVADAAELRIIAAGSPGRASSVAADLGCRPLDDLRSAIATTECDLVLIAGPGAFGAGAGSEDAAAAARAAERGTRIASLEPVPASALEFAGGGWGESPSPVLFCPAGGHWRALRESSELLGAFGPPGTVAVEAWGAPAEGSLGARLFGALEVIHSLVGEPETIEASFVCAGATAGIHALPGESLRGLHGDIAATLRFADGRAATLVASDRAGRWGRSVTLVGPGGRLRIDDAGHEWIGPGGEIVDQTTAEAASGASHAASAIAHSLTRLLEPALPDSVPQDASAVLGIAQAALLSCRTAQGESPATIRRMVGAP